MFSKILTKKSTKSYSENIEALKKAINEVDAIVIGAGAGMSVAAGYVYAGNRCKDYFSDFMDKYHFTDMYSGGFSPFESLEEYWAYWSRYIYINRYMDAPKRVYSELLELVKNKDYFVITTNVDHCFQRAGFEKHRLFYTQGDFGLLQCSEPCHNGTYDNTNMIIKMLHAQGFEIKADGTLFLPDGKTATTTVPKEIVPYCSKCEKPMVINLRSDNTFVEDEGWNHASKKYIDFIRHHENLRVLFLELGVGWNTPAIIKYPFWKMTEQNAKAIYACINFGEAISPNIIQRQSICIDADINKVISACLK